MKKRIERQETILLRKKLFLQELRLSTWKRNYREVQQEGVAQYRRNAKLFDVCEEQRKELAELNGIAPNGSAR